jgi:ADP-ribose pyrophosphatase
MSAAGEPPETAAHLDTLPAAARNPFRTLSSEVVYESRWVRVRQDTVAREDGATGAYGYLEIPYPIVMVAALDDRGRVCLVRQWRYPWGRDSWELPAGRCEAGETPLDGARRELREEAGVAATGWRQLATFYASASIATPFHFFLATGLEHTTTERDAEEHDMVATWVPLETATQAVMDGRVVHSASIGGLLRLERELRGASPGAIGAP